MTGTSESNWQTAAVVQALVFLLAAYNALQVIRAWRGFREAGVSSGLWAGWFSSAAAAAIAAFFIIAPGLAPAGLFFRLPFALGWFVPAIVIALEVQRRLEILGTSRTEWIERIASSTMWIAIGNLALLSVVVVYAMMVAKTMEVPGMPR